VILDARDYDTATIRKLEGWLDTLGRLQQSAVSGVLLKDGVEFSDTGIYDRLGARKVIHVSAQRMFDLNEFSSILNTLGHEKTVKGMKLWVDMDLDFVETTSAGLTPVETLPAETTLVKIEQGEYTRQFTEKAGQLMKYAAMFSVSDEMLQECETGVTFGDPQSMLVRLLRATLDRELSSDPAYRYQQGQREARRFGASDRTQMSAIESNKKLFELLEIISNPSPSMGEGMGEGEKNSSTAQLIGDMMEVVRAYRNGSDVDTRKVAAELTQLQGKDNDFAVGYIYGMLESAAEKYIDENRPFLDQAHTEMFVQSVVEVQLHLMNQGVPVSQLTEWEGIEQGIRQIESSKEPVAGPAGNILARAKQIEEMKSTRTAIAVQLAVNGILFDSWTLMKKETGSAPQVIAAMLRLLDIVDRDEKGLLDSFRKRAIPTILPKTVAAITGAA
jgi:hypothetical protein